jgi:PAS domain S-box-containing protein
LLRDITKLKNSEEANRVSEELFSTLFDLSPLSMTLEDIKTGKFIKVNKTFEVSSGYSSNEVIGKNSVELNLLPENNGQTLVDTFLDKGEINNQEITIKTKSGQMRTGLFSTKIIKVDKTEFLLAITMDITELKQYRKEVGRLDRLDLIGQMAAAISHEIRNPLTVVKGFLQMLTTKPKYLEDNEYFQLMISELDRANSIITNFLSVSRTNSSDLGKHNLNKIIKFIYPLINADALRSEKIISLGLNPIPDLLLDKEEIKQLVLNLVRNGLEAMSAGGCLTISTLLKNEEVV